MAWVPSVVASSHNRCSRSSGVRTIIGVLGFLLVIGFIFLMIFTLNEDLTMPIWNVISGFSVFLIIIVGISAAAASMSQNYKKPKNNTFKSHQSHPQGQSQQANPYLYQNSFQKRFEGSLHEETRQEVPVVEVIGYCRYCGAKIDRDSVFCHLCGSKL